MRSFRTELEDHLLELAWRQWTELGVAGVQRGYPKAAIGIEELILLTAALATADPRLRDESIDWCVAYGDYVSLPRLKSLVKRQATRTRAAFAPYAAVVNRFSNARWPSAEDNPAWSIALSGKSTLRSLQRPSLLNLRLRALVGINARADVLTALLGLKQANVSAADLSFVGYTKRSIAQTLDALTMAGVLQSHRVRNQIRFQWARRSEIEALLMPLPDQIPRWPIILRLLLAFYDLGHRLDGKSEAICAVEATKVLLAESEQMRALSIDLPRSGEEPARTWRAFQGWALAHVKAVGYGTSKLLAGGR